MRSNMTGFFALFLCLLGLVKSQNLFQLLERNKALSEFTEIVKTDEITKLWLEKRRLTVFAPNNDAMQEYHGEKSKSMVSYHISNEDLTSENLKARRTVISQEGNIPLWVNIKDKTDSKFNSEIYINNAKIIRDDERGEGEEKVVQLLHVIDRVLWFLKSKSGAKTRNPNAMQLMEGGTTFDIGDHVLTKFAQEVKQKGLDKLFDTEIPGTFFIPSSNDASSGWGPIDEKTIAAHVVSGKMLFTRTVEEDKEYETTQASSPKIALQMSKAKLHNGTYIWNAKSKTLIGGPKHPKGIVIRKILKANIPVRNGVVHIIDKPLAVIDQTMSEFLDDEKKVRLEKFHHLITNYAPWFKELLLAEKDVTLLAPNNDAFVHIESEYDKLVADDEKLRTVLNFHLVRGLRISSKDDLQTAMVNNSKECAKDDWCIYANRATTVKNDNHVYFRLIKSNKGGNLLTVDGGGVNASVTQPDIAAKNGVVHIINRVLGMPFTTVGDRVEEDPEVSETAGLGRQGGFNNMLSDKDKRFTYFVPNNDAWDLIAGSIPSAKKKLFMGDFKYHTKQILERHLLANKSYTMAELYNMSGREEKTIRTLRGHLAVSMKRGGGVYQVTWEGMTATVVRPDVQCTNGMIHVIDKVLMEEKDVTVSVATSLGASILTMLTLLFAAKYL